MPLSKEGLENELGLQATGDGDGVEVETIEEAGQEIALEVTIVDELAAGVLVATELAADEDWMEELTIPIDELGTGVLCATKLDTDELRALELKDEGLAKGELDLTELVVDEVFAEGRVDDAEPHFPKPSWQAVSQ